MIEMALLLTIQGSAAVVGEPLPDYDCEAPRGHYDKRALEGGKSNVRVAGTILVEDLGRRKSQWWSAAGVLFQPEDGKGGVGFQLWKKPGSKHLSYGVRYLGSDSPPEVGKVPADQPLRFVISLDASGRLDLQINQTRYFVADTKVRPDHPILMCSGGHFRFEQLTSVVAK